MRGLIFEVYRNEQKIGIEDGLLKLQKALRTYKNYKSSFYEVWSESFINYTLILVSFFGTMTPRLQLALTQFYGLILQLLEVYD